MNMKFSGEKETFSTGATQESKEGRPRPELISPLAMKRLAHHYANGAKNHEARNWEAGLPMAERFASLYRHVLDYQEGDREEDHLAAIMWNAAALMHYEEMIARGMLPASLNDMPTYIPILEGEMLDEKADDAIDAPADYPGMGDNIIPLTGRDYHDEQAYAAELRGEDPV